MIDREKILQEAIQRVNDCLRDFSDVKTIASIATEPLIEEICKLDRLLELAQSKANMLLNQCNQANTARMALDKSNKRLTKQLEIANWRCRICGGGYLYDEIAGEPGGRHECPGSNADGQIVRLSIPGSHCKFCGARMGQPLECPGCGHIDPPTKNLDAKSTD